MALRVKSSTPLTGYSSGSLPAVGVEVLDAGRVCEEELQLFADPPEPRSSSEPNDTGRLNPDRPPPDEDDDDNDDGDDD